MLLEALSYIFPFTGSNIGGYPGVIKDEVKGKLVDINNEKELGDVLDIFTQKHNTINKLGFINKEIFSWEGLVQRTLAILINEYKI